MSDYYKTLGVEKNASASDIKKAFYALAGKHHPDKPGGNEAKFKEINEAYQTLSDDKKRAQYDRFGASGPSGSGFGGAGQGNPFGGFDFSGFGGQNGGFEFQFGGDGNIDLGDIMSQMFGGGRPRTPRGRTLQTKTDISFAESLTGVKKTIEIPEYRDGEKKGNKKMDIDIPAGVSNGESFEIRGAGETLLNGNPGDLHIQVSVAPFGAFQRDGRNIVIEKHIPVSSAMLGEHFELELPSGKKITVEIPAGTASGQMLRMRGHGVQTRMQHGDLIIVIGIDIPKKLSKKAREAVEILRSEGL